MKMPRCALAVVLGLAFASASGPATADIVAALSFEQKVVRFDEVTGARIPGWEINLAPFLSPGDRLSGLETNGVDTLYVSSIDAEKVFHFDLASGYHLDPGALFATLPAGSTPGALAIGGDGFLYVADTFGSKVYRYDRITRARTVTADNLAGVGGIAFNQSGNLISTDFQLFQQQPSKVYLGSGGPPNVLVSSGASPLLGPSGVLINDADDSFLVADLPTNRVWNFTASGAQTGFLDVPFPTDVNPFSPPVGTTFLSNFPSDVARLADGSIVVSTLGISSTFQGAPKNYGSLIRYSAGGVLLERMEDSLSPIAAMVLATAQAQLEGDYNRDGFINGADYTTWVNAFGRLVSPYSSADGTGDGVIDAGDYVYWRDRATAAAAVAAQAPEPAGLAVVLGAVGLALLRRRPGSLRRRLS